MLNTVPPVKATTSRTMLSVLKLAACLSIDFNAITLLVTVIPVVSLCMTTEWFRFLVIVQSPGINLSYVYLF